MRHGTRATRSGTLRLILGKCIESPTSSSTLASRPKGISQTGPARTILKEPFFILHIGPRKTQTYPRKQSPLSALERPEYNSAKKLARGRRSLYFFRGRRIHVCPWDKSNILAMNNHFHKTNILTSSSIDQRHSVVSPSASCPRRPSMTPPKRDRKCTNLSGKKATFIFGWPHTLTCSSTKQQTKKPTTSGRAKCVHVFMMQDCKNSLPRMSNCTLSAANASPWRTASTRHSTGRM